MNESVTHLVNQINDESSENLLQRIVENAVAMRDTHDLKIGIEIIRDYKELLLCNGVFLCELLDVYEDTIHNN